VTEEERYKNYFETFKEVSRLINSTLSLKEVFNRAVKKVSEVMGVKGVTLRLLDEKSKRLELAASYGISEEYLKKGPVEADKSVADAMEGIPVAVYDVAHDVRVQYKEAAVKEDVASMLSVPLVLRGKVIGVLRLYTSKPRAFGADEVEFVQALAEQAAIAIENARLYESVKGSYEQLMKDVYRWFEFGAR
jgi:GAF domain-containing protein